MWWKILAQFQDPLIYLMLVAIALSARLDGLRLARCSPRCGVVLNAVFGSVQENKVENAVAFLQSMTAVNSTVWRDGPPWARSRNGPNRRTCAFRWWSRTRVVRFTARRWSHRSLRRRGAARIRAYEGRRLR